MSSFVSTLHEALRSRNVEVHERGLLTFVVGGQSAMLVPIGDELTDALPQQRVGSALVALADFSRQADAVMGNELLSSLGKNRELTRLTTEIAARLQRDLEEAGQALVGAEREASKDRLPVPVAAADASQAIVDSELRALIRQMEAGEAMRAMERQYSFLVAVMRQPLGIDEGVVAYAQRLWAERNPNAQQSTAAMRMAASWREARRILGEARAAVTLLTNGRVPATLAA